MKRISIKQEYEKDHTSRVAGERLRESILSAYQKGIAVELDFTGLKIASTSFFDEAIAKLAEEGWTGEIVLQFVKFKGIHRLDFKVLEQVCKYRGLSLSGDGSVLVKTTKGRKS